MKLNDIIDIDGKLYQIVCIGDDDSFKAEPIGKVVAKGFIRPQDNREIIKELDAFCDCQSSCRDCCLDKYLDCSFGYYDNEQLNIAYKIMKEHE